MKLFKVFHPYSNTIFLSLFILLTDKNKPQNVNMMQISPAVCKTFASPA